jgi:hypothetical protein
MKSDQSFEGKGRPWAAPTVTKLAIGTETKAPVGVEADKNAEPPPPATPASKFGLALEWSFPLSARTD